MVRIATRRPSGHPTARIASPSSRRGAANFRDEPAARSPWRLVTRFSRVRRRSKPPRARLPGRGSFLAHMRAGQAHTVAYGQVVLIQCAAAVDSLWDVPGFGDTSPPVMVLIGMLIIRAGSHLAD